MPQEIAAAVHTKREGKSNLHALREAFAAALTRDLDRCAALERETMAIIAELAALTVGGISPQFVQP